MNIAIIAISAALIAAIGIVVGIGLGVFGAKFEVEVDEREGLIRGALPGNNCGGCGYPGCDAAAKAINEGRAPVTLCPVGQKPVWDAIGKIMGVEAGDAERMVAFVKCAGSCDIAKKRYNYEGPKDCNSIIVPVPGGSDKACQYGCLGYGSCEKACQFGAIRVIDGVARVDEDKCTACGACVKTCPKKLIELVPASSLVRVQCQNNDRGKAVMDVCAIGCIGCTLCVKTCKFDAIHMDGNVAHIDYEKCKMCGACANKCPRHIILNKRLIQKLMSA